MKLTEFIAKEIQESVLINSKAIGRLPNGRIYGIRYPKNFRNDRVQSTEYMPKDIRDVINEYIDDMMEPEVDKLKKDTRELMINGSIITDTENAWYDDRCLQFSRLMSVIISLRKCIKYVDTVAKDCDAFWFVPRGDVVSTPQLYMLTIDNCQVCKLHISKTDELCTTLTDETYPVIHAVLVPVLKNNDTDKPVGCTINVEGYPSISESNIEDLLTGKVKNVKYLLNNNSQTMDELKNVDFTAKYPVCTDCKKRFIITEGEANWYKEKGLKLPKRCKECRDKRKGNIPKS